MSLLHAWHVIVGSSHRDQRGIAEVEVQCASN
jgi:hypothetical protein